MNTEFRVGIGHDTHRLGAERPLILGGIAVPHTSGLVGHSDADVLLHAITDALLGGAGLGDIGEHFPDHNPEYLGADSGKLLANALKLVREPGWQVVNLDCTVHAERPKLVDVKPRIRERVAELLGISQAAVNIKAKTGEKVGPIGREEAISADAVVLLSRATSDS